MRFILITALILLAVGTFSLASGVFAQTSPQERVPVTPKLKLTLEQHHVIREIIKETKPKAVPDPVKVEVGDKLPEDIKTQAIPTQVAQRVPQIKGHEFFVANEQIFIVDPKDKKIADVIKLTTD